MAKQARTLELDAGTECCPSVLAAPLDVADAAELASAFSALSDPVRLRVLNMLAASPDGEVCVCEFVEPLGRSQPTISHHMKILSEAGLVQGDRRGKWVWYSLNHGRLAQLRAALDA
jgi:ArsR family transcriptional regulator